MNNEGCDSRRLSLPLDARVPRLRKVSRQGDRPPKRFRRGVDGKLLAVYNKSVCVDGWRGGWLMQSDRGRTYAETCASNGNIIEKNAKSCPCACEEKGTHPKPQKVKPKPRTEKRGRPNPRARPFLISYSLTPKSLQEWESSTLPAKSRKFFEQQ